LSASGLAGTEFSAFSMKLGREIGVDSLEWELLIGQGVDSGLGELGLSSELLAMS
jgi:hypothetical protein